MKKLFIILALLFVLIPSAFAIDLPPQVYDASSLQIYMRKNFYYGEDRVIPGYFEYFQLPPVLEFTRIGDCDDFATYSWYHLAKMGYVAQTYALILEYDNETVGHAITVFLDKDGTYSVFSNQLMFKTLETNPLDAIKDIYPSWTIIFEWNATRYGYLTVEEVYTDFVPVDFVNIKTGISYYWDIVKDKVFNYVDF